MILFNIFQKVNMKLHLLVNRKNSAYYSSKGSGLSRGKFSEFKFIDRIKNLTNNNFSNKEIKFLNNGLKFSVQTNFKMRSLEELAIDIDSLLESLHLDNNIKK